MTAIKAPRVPAGPNSLAASRRAFMGAIAMAPIALLPAAAATTPSLAQHWEIDRRALHAIDVSEDHSDDADPELWAIISKAEDAILKGIAKSPEDVIAKLKVALLHSGSEAWVDAALIDDDHVTLFARADELDITDRIIIGAIRDLRKGL